MNVYKIIVNDGTAMLETRTKKKKIVLTLFNTITKNLETRTKLFEITDFLTTEINDYKEALKHAKYKIVDVEKSNIIVRAQYPICELIECYNNHKYDGDPFVEELDEVSGDLEDVFESAINKKDGE